MMPRSAIPVKNMLLRKPKMATGWMSNRGRQNVASYLIHDLGINWIEGAKFFEKYLIDYDPTSKYCNWRYNAGTGSHPEKYSISPSRLQFTTLRELIPNFGIPRLINPTQLPFT